MKRLFLLLLVMGIAASLFAQVLPQYQSAAGNWTMTGSRLFQNDAGARLAKANIQIPQANQMVYEFNARYEGGIEDGHGGFGIHVFVDNAFNGASWGAGRSYLLWLNYDENPGVNSGISTGLSGQVYKSVNNSQMNLVHNISLNNYLPMLLAPRALENAISIKIEIDGNTGEFRIYDPTDMNTYYYFFIDRTDVPLRGNWVSLRTNGIRASFGLGL